MPGPLPKPDAERVRTTPAAFAWTDLPPEGRRGPAPKLPPLRDWHPTTVASWAHWWSTPQATQWDPSGTSLHRWALLHDLLVTGDGPAPALAANMTALEDRHGFTPAAMAKLRWRILSGAAAVPAPARPAAKGRRARVLAAVPEVPDAG